MLPALEEAARAAQGGLAAAKADLQAARSDLDQIQPTLQATRQMDWAIAQKTAAIDRLVEQEAQLDRQLAESSHDVEQNQESLARLQAEQAAWTAKWAETAADEGLTTNIAGIAAQFRQIRETQADIRAQELQLSQEREQEKAGAQTCADLARTAQEAGSEAEVATAALAGIRRRLSDLLGERSLAEYRTEWAALQREARLCQKIMDLEAERQKLSDGQPCPLCGATDHPFARGNLPELDEIEQKSAALTRLIEQAEQLNQQILEQTERITGKQQACQEAERQLQMAEADLRRSKALSGQRAQEAGKQVRPPEIAAGLRPEPDRPLRLRRTAARTSGRGPGRTADAQPGASGSGSKLSGTGHTDRADQPSTRSLQAAPRGSGGEQPDSYQGSGGSQSAAPDPYQPAAGTFWRQGSGDGGSRL
jgi:DNA repair exonuclease SbcCD ATPase subunit